MPREVSLIEVVYHPPKANNAEMNGYLLSILDSISVSNDHPSSGILLLGDFNQLPESQLRSYPLVQLVTSPTRGSNILDKISTDVKCWYQSTFDLPHVGSCDHHGVLLQPL